MRTCRCRPGPPKRRGSEIRNSRAARLAFGRREVRLELVVATHFELALRYALSRTATPLGILPNVHKKPRAFRSGFFFIFLQVELSLPAASDESADRHCQERDAGRLWHCGRNLPQREKLVSVRHVDAERVALGSEAMHATQKEISSSSTMFATANAVDVGGVNGANGESRSRPSPANDFWNWPPVPVPRMTL